MSRVRTLTSLIADCRQRANMENSAFVSDTEITEYINQELAELYARLVQAQGHPHYRASTTYTVTPQTNLQSLPADFWQLQEVVITVGGMTGPIFPFMSTERGSLTNGQPSTGGVMYRIQAGNIEFVPPTQAFTATVYYTPCAPRLVSGSDSFDGFNGYEVAAIHGTVATMLAKEESDPSFYVGQKERILRHIDSLAGMRDASSPERVQDVQCAAWPDGWWL
jgi:hypothetical protein